MDVQLTDVTQGAGGGQPGRPAGAGDPRRADRARLLGRGVRLPRRASTPTSPACPACCCGSGSSASSATRSTSPPPTASTCGTRCWRRGEPHGHRARSGSSPSGILRLQKMHILVGQDTDSESTPFGAAMPWIVKLDKDGGLHRQVGARARRRAAGRDRAGRLHAARRRRADRGRGGARRARRARRPGDERRAARAQLGQRDRDGLGAGARSPRTAPAITISDEGATLRGARSRRAVLRPRRRGAALVSRRLPDPRRDRRRRRRARAVPMEGRRAGRRRPVRVARRLERRRRLRPARADRWSRRSASPTARTCPSSSCTAAAGRRRGRRLGDAPARARDAGLVVPGDADRALLMRRSGATPEVDAAREAATDVVDLTSELRRAARSPARWRRELLARFCALDLRAQARPVGGFRPGSVARTPGYRAARGRRPVPDPVRLGARRVPVDGRGRRRGRARRRRRSGVDALDRELARA